MTSPISQVVQVTVTRGTRPIQQASFDTPMFLATVNFFSTNQRHRIYTSVADMASDGFPTNHPAYIFASKLFSQDARPDTVVIGRQNYTNFSVTPTVQDDATYTLQVGVEGNVKTYTFTSDSSATATEIVDGFVSLINADADVNTRIVAANSSDVLTVTPNTDEEVYVIGQTANLAVAVTGAEDITTAVNAVSQAYNEWFFLAAQSLVEADVLALALWANANDKMYLASADVTTVGDSGVSNDIASQLRDLQYDNTTTITVDQGNLDEYAEGGAIGSVAAINPGVTTLFAKTLEGVPAENFTTTQRTTITSKNSNYYDLRGGVGFFFDGRQASGEWFDTIRFSLWAKARTAEAIFGLLKRKSDLGQKVPQSDEGDDMIRQAIFNGMINVGTRRGAILTAEDGAVDPVVRIVPRSQRTTNDLAQRILRDVEVELTFSGAVQDVRVQVFVQV